MADGTEATDAVNPGQLHRLAERVTQLQTSLAAHDRELASLKARIVAMGG